MQHVERVARRTVEPGLAAAAELIEPDGGKRSDQREPGGDRKRQRQQRAAQRHRDQKNAEQRIDDAEEYSVARHRGEIVDAAGERLIEIGRRDAAHDGSRGTCARADENMCIGHGAPPEPKRFNRQGRRWARLRPGPQGARACVGSNRRSEKRFAFSAFVESRLQPEHHATRAGAMHETTRRWQARFTFRCSSHIVRSQRHLLRVRAKNHNGKIAKKERAPARGALSMRIRDRVSGASGRGNADGRASRRRRSRRSGRHNSRSTGRRTDSCSSRSRRNNT